MSNSLKQSMKQRLQTVAKERDLTFSEVWHNLILERFLARLCQSNYKSNFILKGGSLLARYIPLGRETKDLDFLVDKLQNTEEFLSKAFDHICSIRLEDGFKFEKVKISKLTHPHMDYTGIEVLFCKVRWATNLYSDRSRFWGYRRGYRLFDEFNSNIERSLI